MPKEMNKNLLNRENTFSCINVYVMFTFVWTFESSLRGNKFDFILPLSLCTVRSCVVFVLLPCLYFFNLAQQSL